MSGYLIHHGIKGQQWGVQNGPPYPLSREFTKDEIKALYKDAEKTKHFSRWDSENPQMFYTDITVTDIPPKWTTLALHC